MSVAAGHARELELSTAFNNGMVKRFVAFDQDADSLKVIKQRCKEIEIECVESSIKMLLTKKHILGNFDVVYVAGLYDYLTPKVATSLTERLFELLNPGGAMLYANFATNIDDVGYMEACMDWWLTYRSSNETWELAKNIDGDMIESYRRYNDPDENIHFVQINKSSVA